LYKIQSSSQIHYDSHTQNKLKLSEYIDLFNDFCTRLTI